MSRTTRGQTVADPSAAIDALLRASGVRPNPGARAAEVAGAESALQIELPDDVRALYQRCNGADLAPGLSLLTLDDAVATSIAINQRPNGSSRFNYLALTDNNDSNPVCVVCGTPLAGHVVHIFHDNEPRVLFRSLSDFLGALARHLARGGRNLEQMPHAFAAVDRTPGDAAVGHELFALAPELVDTEGDDVAVYRYAVALLGPDHVLTIADLLEHDNEYVRRSAVERLRQLDTPLATEALGHHAQEERSFAVAVVKALKAAGIDAALDQRPGRAAVSVNSGAMWLNMEAFFRHRRAPEGLAAVVQRVRELIALRNGR